MNNDIKGERRREFLAEAEDILNSMGKDLLKLGKGVKAGIIDPTVLNSVFRSVHTLKGMSGVFDFKDMATLSHSFEDILDMLRLGRLTLTDEVLDCIMGAHDLLVRIVDSKGRADLKADVSSLIELLNKNCKIKKPASTESIGKEFLSVLTEYEEHRLRENLRESKNIFIVNVKFSITNFDKGYSALTEALKADAEVIATLPSTKTSHEMLYFDILIGTARERDHILSLIKVITEADIRLLAEAPATGANPEARAWAPPDHSVRPRQTEAAKETLRRSSNTVRVNIKKFDNIMSIISELGILKSSVAKLSAELKNESRLSAYGIRLSRVENYLEKKFGELRDSVLDVRMVPIGHLFSRFETFIDKLARESGKEIRMVTHGDETELDKLIVEELADPLMHIIRNVADHAIEPPLVREASGKPRTGTVTLSACQKGNHVVVEVEDDGVGIDIESLSQKAVEKGLITREYIKTLTRQEILELIFAPGFSTRDVVSDTSGRGVGMDVVKDNITRLSGIIDIDTVKGKGTRIMLTIPITLAIIQALIVEEGGHNYAVPMGPVIEIIELDRRLLKTSGPQEFITVNGRNVPVVRLNRFLGREDTSYREICYGIVAGLAEHRLCIIVEQLVEELDVVIKPLPRIIKVPGIAGVTDMGEKGTILVLDVTGIIEMQLKERKVAAQEAV